MRCSSVLEEMAEIGRGALDDRRRSALDSMSQSLDRAGAVLANAAHVLSTSTTGEAACRILRGRYLTAVYRELASF